MGSRIMPPNLTSASWLLSFDLLIPKVDHFLALSLGPQINLRQNRFTRFKNIAVTSLVLTYKQIDRQVENIPVTMTLQILKKKTTKRTRRWHVTISCQPDGRPPQPVRPWKSGRVHLAEGSNVIVLELPYSTEFGRDSRKFASGVRKYGKFSHFLTYLVVYGGQRKKTNIIFSKYS